MIILMNGHSLSAKDRFQAEKLGVQLSERQSTATRSAYCSAAVFRYGNSTWHQGQSIKKKLISTAS